ncbi:MAG: HD domain-containing protein [bacterium]|nr:HD domain-containing protein [bacterium]
MTEHIPEEILEVYNKVQKAGFEAYLVGGSIRNLLLKKPVKDWDMTTNATPEQILKIFPHGFYDNKFGTVGVPIDLDNQKKVVEITTFRTEDGYSDSRHPEKVSWGKSIEEDLARRDFTINSIALEIATSDKRQAINLIDPFNGQQDIKDKLIRAVGDPKARFKEDALRLLRGIRIATELSFNIEEKTRIEITTDAPLIEKVSGERIRIELLRILASDSAYEGIMLLKDTKLLEHILPELIEGIGISQVRPGRHHTDDVFTHNILSLKFCPSTDPIVRFAAFLHDVGKPKVMGKDEDGLVIFYNHEIAGANIARDICDRLKFSKKEKDKIVNLIRWHMFTVDEKVSDAGIRRFIRKIGVENVKDMMDLRVGDRLGGGTQTAESWRLKLFKQRIEDQLKPLPFSINDLAIDGNDIIKELKIKPGPKIGEILQKLFLEVDEDLSKNKKELLLKRIKELN